MLALFVNARNMIFENGRSTGRVQVVPLRLLNQLVIFQTGVHVTELNPSLTSKNVQCVKVRVTQLFELLYICYSRFNQHVYERIDRFHRRH